MRTGTAAPPAFHGYAGSGPGDFLRRQVGRLAGFAVLGFVAFALASLGTWNVADPSFSNATDTQIQNAMGYPGAVFSDLAMQFFGLSAVAALAPAVAWAILLMMAAGIDRKTRRALGWLAASILAAGVAGCITPPETWPLPTGLGGVFGDLVLKGPAMMLGHYPTGLPATLIAVALTAPALFLAGYGAGLLLRRPEGEEMDAADIDPADDEDAPGLFTRSLGAATHLFFSMRGALRRRRPQMVRPPRMRETQPVSGGWRAAAERVETAERAEAKVSPAGRARVEPEFFAAMVADGRVPAREPEFADAADVEDDDRDGGEALLAERPSPAPMVAAEQPMVAPRRPATAFTGHVQRFRSPARRQDPAMPSFEQDEAAELVIEPEVEAEPDTSAFDMPAEEPYPLPMLAPRETAAPMVTAPVASAPAARPMMPVAMPASMAAQSVIRVAPPAPRPEPVADVRREFARMINGVADMFALPSLSFLAEPKSIARDASLSADALEQNARMLEGVLEDFGVKGEIVQVRPGPVVTLYELEPAPGIKSSRVIGLADDIARSMSAIACRVAVVPGRNAIGIELPNLKRETVYLREMLASRDFNESAARLALALGKTINGEPVVVDIAKMPHVLVAGTTGSGKSVAINTMVLSLLYKMTPEKCRLIMIDPKMVELSVYDGIPHLLTPVVTNPKKAVVALKWTVREMEDRYRKMAKVGVRNIDGFNARVAAAELKNERISRTVQTGFDKHTGEAVYETEEFDLKPFPFIVVIIDEVADLMMVAGKDIEGAVQRLGQMARAAGIHVIMATQRPSVDVITGTIKANFPTRMSFQVTSKIDSRTILGEQGAEQLLGMGDMLYMAGGGRIQRVHGPFVSDDEVEKVVAHLKLQGAPEYLDAITADDEDAEEDDDAPAGRGGAAAGGETFDESEDPYDQAVAVVLRDGKVSTSYIQRRLGIGYNRAASIIEKMEKEGIVGPANHAGKREILVPTEEDKM